MIKTMDLIPSIVLVTIKDIISTLNHNVVLNSNGDKFLNKHRFNWVNRIPKHKYFFLLALYKYR